MKQAKTAARVAVVIGLAIIALQIDSRPAEAAAVIKASAVCKKGSSFCISFTNASSLPSVVASYTFNAPSAGTALVSFNGSMQCDNDGINDASHGVIDLTTQIMTGGGTPNFQAPGGSRFTMRLNPSGIPDHSVAVNLASARVVAVTAGANTFNFKILRNRMDGDTSCTVWNGDFNVVFVP